MRLIYTVKGCKGAAMLSGEVGCGKTTICKVFQERLMNEGYAVGFITNPNLSSMELLQEMLFSFNEKFTGLSKIQLLHALQDMA